MTEPFFPFRLYSNEHGTSPNGFRETFLANKPKTIQIEERFGTFVYVRTENFSWYCFDVIVKSQTEIEFVCFDMADFLDGGKGKEFYRFSVTVDKNITKEYIARRLFLRGADRREQELEEQERKIYQKYANEERQELGIKF